MRPIPEWVDRSAYPFSPGEFSVAAGTMSYVDEGTGTPIVMVHGNPYWSFEYRHLIRHFSGGCRCIAPDHIGFGLSDKPADWDYLPRSHAANLEALLESLDLKDITLVVNDWGGPLGLAYAIGHPDRVANVVITNTWCWPVDDDWYYRAFSGFVGGPLGRFLIRRGNLFARDIVPRVFGDRGTLTKEIHDQILAPLEVVEERKGTWVFPKQIIGSTEWLRDLWSQREVLAGKVKLIAWGMKDIAFREKELNRWSEAFPEARVARLPDAGHFVADEAAGDLIAAMEAASLL
jgi:haloalkane dehalogenase